MPAPGARHRGALCVRPPAAPPGSGFLARAGRRPPEKPFHAAARRPHWPGERPGAQSLFHGARKGEGEPAPGPAAPGAADPHHGTAQPSAATGAHWELLPVRGTSAHSTPKCHSEVCPRPQLLNIPLPTAVPPPQHPPPHRGRGGPVLTPRPSCASACSRWGGVGRCRSRIGSPWGLS